MWALIDNYDSFTYILHHYLLMTGHDCVVFRNDEITIEGLIKLSPDRIIISPGPETPLQAGITMQVIDYFHHRLPILGICLGHQALGMYFGAKLMQLSYPVHGKTSLIHHTDHLLFTGITSPFTAMRYHSLALVGIETTGFNIIATSEDNCIMAIAHRQFPCIGVQFHPESVGTEHGLQLLKNWARMW